jgi:hypothetical protein
MFSRRPRYKRADHSPPMRFQDRDGAIIQAIYDNDGVLARRHLKAMFWPGATKQAMEQRLSLLYHNGYLNWPNIEQRRTKPIPEPVIWLGWRGVLSISGQHDVQVQPPKSDNENQLRTLENHLRDQGIRWHREPRWIQLAHDLAVVDFKLAVERSVLQLPSYKIDQWLSESVFRSNTDVVSFQSQGKDGKVRTAKKGVCPDAYFEIVDESRKASGEPHRARFLLELDRATHDNPSFGREKVLPGVAYIKSSEYKTRFGYNSGRWLVVTLGQRRMENLMLQTQEKAKQDAPLFFFTTLDHLATENVFTSPIWLQPNSNKPISLI